jgi:hypothetical protein
LSNFSRRCSARAFHRTSVNAKKKKTSKNIKKNIKLQKSTKKKKKKHKTAVSSGESLSDFPIWVKSPRNSHTSENVLRNHLLFAPGPYAKLARRCLFWSEGYANGFLDISYKRWQFEKFDTATPLL